MQKTRVQIVTATLSGNSLRQTAHTHCASVHQAAKLVAALLRVARVTAGLAESNGSLLPGLWLTSPTGWLPRTGISSRTLRSVIEYGLPLPFYSTRNVWNSYRSTCRPCTACSRCSRQWRWLWWAERLLWSQAPTTSPTNVNRQPLHQLNTRQTDWLNQHVEWQWSHSVPVDLCRHLVGKTPRNVCHRDSASVHFVGKSVIMYVDILLN